MSNPRFFHIPLPAHGPVDLDEAEARHASTVLRLRVGAAVALFDGQGGEAQGVVTVVGKRHVQVNIIERTDEDRELSRPLELLVALPKGERQKTLIDGLVQFGVTRLTPLICARGVAQPVDAALERLRRGVVESSKQCGRNRLMEIPAARSITEFAQDDSAEQFAGISLVAHPYGSSTSLSDPNLGRPESGSGSAARVAIGPEGGFTDQELAGLAGAGWGQVALGPRLLRIEYAALLVAAWWATTTPHPPAT